MLFCIIYTYSVMYAAVQSFDCQVAINLSSLYSSHCFLSVYDTMRYNTKQNIYSALASRRMVSLIYRTEP